MEQQGMRVEDFLSAIKKRWKMIIGIITITVVVVMMISNKANEVKIEYKLNSKIYVYDAEENISIETRTENQVKYNDLMINLAETLKSRTFMQSVLNEANSKMDINHFYESLWVTPILNSSVIKFEIIGNNKEELTKILNIIQSRVIDISPKVIENSKVEVIENTNLISQKDVTGRNLLPIMLLLLGVFGSFMLAFLLEYLDDSVKNEDQIEKKYNFPVLGKVKFDKNGESKDEDFIKVRTTFKCLRNKTEKNIISIVNIGDLKNQQKTTEKLCESLGKVGYKVLNIQSDYHNSETRKGITDIIKCEQELESIICKDNNYFDRIEIGNIRNNINIIESKEVDKVFEELKLKYDYIFVNVNDVEVKAKEQILVAKSDVSILLVKLNKTKIKKIEDSVSLIRKLNNDVIGTIISW